MANEKRGIRQIRTVGGLFDRRRARTSAGALLELSLLESEKMRLAAEIGRAEQRCGQIRHRLDEINSKQHRLRSFVDDPQGEKPSDADIPTLPIHTPPLDRFKKRRLSY